MNSLAWVYVFFSVRQNCNARKEKFQNEFECRSFFVKLVVVYFPKFQGLFLVSLLDLFTTVGQMGAAVTHGQLQRCKEGQIP